MKVIAGCGCLIWKGMLDVEGNVKYEVEREMWKVQREIKEKNEGER